MSRQRDNIEKALNARGWTASEMYYEAVKGNGEGGWVVTAVPVNKEVLDLEWITGTTWDDVLAHIDAWLRDFNNPPAPQEVQGVGWTDPAITKLKIASVILDGAIRYGGSSDG